VPPRARRVRRVRAAGGGGRGADRVRVRAECLCHEYGWTLDAALDTPLATAYALINCARQRNGGKNGGPDYYGRVQMAEAARAFRKAREERETKRKAEEEAARKEAVANG